jgi:DNA (cytosine-5)-methyltransferase 1
MSWLFSRALVAEYSAGTCSDGAQSAQLSVMLTQQQFWRNDKTMDCSKHSLFGLTLRHLTARDGEALLISFLEDFHARTLAQPERELELGGGRSGLWREMARIIGEVRPRFAFVENSPLLVRRGLDQVLGDLAELGFDARWGIISAANAGAPHLRERIWILAHAKHNRLSLGRGATDARTEGDRPTRISGDEQSCLHVKTQAIHANADRKRLKKQWSAVTIGEKHTKLKRRSWWSVEPDVGRVVNGVACRVDRLKAIGNGQVPAVVKLAWKTLI